MLALSRQDSVELAIERVDTFGDRLHVVSNIFDQDLRMRLALIELLGRSIPPPATQTESRTPGLDLN